MSGRLSASLLPWRRKERKKNIIFLHCFYAARMRTTCVADISISRAHTHKRVRRAESSRPKSITRHREATRGEKGWKRTPEQACTHTLSRLLYGSSLQCTFPIFDFDSRTTTDQKHSSSLFRSSLFCFLCVSLAKWKTTTGRRSIESVSHNSQLIWLRVQGLDEKGTLARKRRK